jgi:beta-lactamase superfamily II metal-dependent hydrolase
MRLHIFQSADGDCLLLESKDKRLILCDGGRSASMIEFVRGELSKLRGKKRKIDYAYVSHIDNDHITGVLQLLEDEVEWRVFDHHKAAGHTGIKKPTIPRPPEIGGLWHNSFSDQLQENSKTVADMLASAAPVLLATRVPQFADCGEEYYDIATAVKEGILVSRLAAPEMLGVPRNKLPGTAKPAKLLLAGHGPAHFKVGSMTLTIVGPTEKELELLREGWNTWLSEHADAVKKLDDELKKRMQEFSTNSDSGPIDLFDWNGLPPFKGVSVPNIASLMFMVEEDGKRLLLTGDSQQDIIVDGLKKAGFLQDGGGVHIDVLKVQHHGSENNLDKEFGRRVSANHYVFCGNGAHENPDLKVLKLVFNSRLGSKTSRALAPEADGRPFKWWFSTSSNIDAKPAENAHMREVEDLVADLAAKSGGLMTFHFNENVRTILKI